LRYGRGCRELDAGGHVEAFKHHHHRDCLLRAVPLPGTAAIRLVDIDRYEVSKRRSLAERHARRRRPGLAIDEARYAGAIARQEGESDPHPVGQLPGPSYTTSDLPDAYANSWPDANGTSYTTSDLPDAWPNANANSWHNANANPRSNANANPWRDADTDSYINPSTNANPNPGTHANPNPGTHADTGADSAPDSAAGRSDVVRLTQRLECRRAELVDRLE